jgi:hypothetical protein
VPVDVTKVQWVAEFYGINDTWIRTLDGECVCEVGHNQPNPSAIREMIAKTPTLLQALAEIERVASYASEGTAARMAMLAWIAQAARDAQAGKWITEPLRQGPSIKTGDVLVKAGPFPPKGK